MAKTLCSIDFMVQGLRTVSEANDRSHWAVKNKRKQEQQQLVAVAMQNALQGKTIELPCTVKLTRIGPKGMDDDNLIRSCKGVRDILAQKLGADDGSDQIKFEYYQQPVAVRTYGLKVQITSQE